MSRQLICLFAAPAQSQHAPPPAEDYRD